MHRKFLIALFLAIATLLSLRVTVAADYDATPVVKRVVVEFIRPSMRALSDRAEGASQSTASLCTTPSEQSLDAARTAFVELVESWGRVEMVRLGPLSENNRLERMLFWPDRRGRGLKQVQDIIRTSDETALDVQSLEKKSVAVQGLLALEFTLFGTGSEALSSGDATARCSYALAISTNLANIANDVEAEWSSDDPDSISMLWLNSSNTNPLFRDAREQVAALFEIVGEGLEIIKVQRLDPFLRDDFSDARPKSALFWRSGSSVKSISANIEGLEAILMAAKLDELVSASDKRKLDGLFFEFSNAISTLAATNFTPEQIAGSKENYDRLNYARIVVSSMSAILRGQLSPMFNLSAGFSSLDGD